MKYLIVILLFLFSLESIGQPIQTHRFELEKKNTDNYFNVLPFGDKGVIIFRDTDDFDDGNVWNIIALDTTLTEKWNIELSIDSKYIFKGYDTDTSKLYLLFREGKYEKRDYHLMTVSINDGAIDRYDIQNEIALELSHMSILPSGLALGGYVNFSPTIMTYTFGDESFNVVPGFFKDRSDIVDLSDNGNSSFNIITLEKDYDGNYLRLRTHSYDGDMLFEREVKAKEDIKILSAKSSGFIDGNVVIAGTYSIKNSYYASGFYITIVKPTGQQNITKYHNFYSLNHFFDYMRPKRASRLKARMKKRMAKGKDVNFPTRVTLHEIRNSDNGYLLFGELYDPNFNSNSYIGYGQLSEEDELRRRSLARQNYSKQPSNLQHLDGAQSFEYLESILLKLNTEGELLWDNSLKIEELETADLERIVQINQNTTDIDLLYKAEEEIYFKSIENDKSSVVDNLPIKLEDEYDQVINTIKGIGKAEYWYNSNFMIWGYHRVENKVRASKENVKKSRLVVYVNKIHFK